MHFSLCTVVREGFSANAVQDAVDLKYVFSSKLGSRSMYDMHFPKVSIHYHDINIKRRFVHINSWGCQSYSCAIKDKFSFCIPLADSNLSL